MPAVPPKLIIHYGANYENDMDISTYTKEVKMTCEDIDDSKSGRDDKTGIMYRNRVLRVHTLEVTLRRVTQSEIHNIHVALMNVSNPFFQVEYLCPCASYRIRYAYVSRMNYGAQRYNKRGGYCYYDGVTFSIVERGEG